MFAGVAEGPGHAAAAGVEVDHLGPGHARQQGPGRRQEAERLLVAVPVQQQPFGARLQVEADGAGTQLAFQPLLEQDAGGGHVAGLLLRVAAQQRREVVAQGRQAARLEDDDRLSRRGEGMESGHGVLAPAPRLAQQALRDEGAAAADVGTEGDPDPGVVADGGRGHPDLGVVVVGEGVGEQDDGRTVAVGGTRTRAPVRPQGAGRPPRQRPPAVQPQEPLVEGADPGPAQPRVDEPRERAHRGRQLPDVPEQPRPQRRPVPGVVVG